MTKFEKRIADTLFVPLIIRACQALDLDQNRFAGWMLGIGWLIITIDLFSSNLWIIMFMGVISLLLAAANFAFPGTPKRPSYTNRVILWFVTGLSLLIFAPTVLTWNIVFLFAEYALLIDRIPPRDSRRTTHRQAYVG